MPSRSRTGSRALEFAGSYRDHKRSGTFTSVGHSSRSTGCKTYTPYTTSGSVKSSRLGGNTTRWDPVTRTYMSRTGSRSRSRSRSRSGRSRSGFRTRTGYSRSGEPIIIEKSSGGSNSCCVISSLLFLILGAALAALVTWYIMKPGETVPDKNRDATILAEGHASEVKNLKAEITRLKNVIAGQDQTDWKQKYDDLNGKTWSSWISENRVLSILCGLGSVAALSGLGYYVGNMMFPQEVKLSKCPIPKNLKPRIENLENNLATCQKNLETAKAAQVSGAATLRKCKTDVSKVNAEAAKQEGLYTQLLADYKNSDLSAKDLANKLEKLREQNKNWLIKNQGYNYDKPFTTEGAEKFMAFKDPNVTHHSGDKYGTQCMEYLIDDPKKEVGKIKVCKTKFATHETEINEKRKWNPVGDHAVIIPKFGESGGSSWFSWGPKEYEEQRRQ